MKAGSAATWTTVIASVAIAMAGMAEAGSVKNRAPKNEFKDLPGVSTPEDELSARNACTTELMSARNGPQGRRWPQRVYVCHDGPFTYIGTTPPNEYDWRQVRKRDSGF